MNKYMYTILIHTHTSFREFARAAAAAPIPQQTIPFTTLLSRRVMNHHPPSLPSVYITTLLHHPLYTPPPSFITLHT